MKKLNIVRWLPGTALLVLSWSISPIVLAEDPGLVYLDQRSYVRRLAMDLKGTLPTSQELDSQPWETDALIDAYLHAPEFNNQMLWLANDVFLTRTDRVEYFSDSYNYRKDSVRYDVAKAVGEEPLRLFVYIAQNDRPLTDLVAADYTVANSTLAWFWNISYNGPTYGSQWMRGRYGDGREHAGVLSQTSFYYRYPSTASNKQRHRANQLTRIFLDDDHLLRNVSINLRLSNADPNLDLHEATLRNKGCVSCHATLDGIGAHIMGVALGPDEPGLYARQNFGMFSSQGRQRSEMLTGRDPEFYGFPTRGLKDLGNFIARDPRFARAMAKHAATFLLHRDLDYRDRDTITTYSTALVNSGFNTRAMIKAIVKSDQYRAVGVAGGNRPPASSLRSTSEQYEADYTLSWQQLKAQVAASNLSAASREELTTLLDFHAMETGFSQRAAAPRYASAGRPRPGGTRGLDPAPYWESVQPFKLATPEQLNSLGNALVGEIWDGGEGGQWMPDAFPHLEYNSDIKIAAGGYDGNTITKRRWSVPPTYMLVVERWAEVLAQDVFSREIWSDNANWKNRMVYTKVSVGEDLHEAEPLVRAQLVDWFYRFYGERLAPDAPEINDMYGVMLLASEEAKIEHGNWAGPSHAWQQALGLMLSDPRIAIY